MPTAADSNTSTPSTASTQYAIATTALAIFIGLVWGALMLAVFGYWMRTKYEGRLPMASAIFLYASGATAILAGWQGFTLWFKQGTPEEITARLLNQRNLFSYVFLAAGIGLVLIAFLLGFDKKTGPDYTFNKENFAETFGAILFGLIALAAGYYLQQPYEAEVSPIQFLLDMDRVMKMGLIIVGAASLGGFGYGLYRGAFTAYFPELLALLSMSMLCLACLLWLNAGQFEEFGIRLFVLIFGGSVGLILFLMILCRAYLWRRDIFTGGQVAWQGPDAWHFWLCAYVLFISLVLMFVSFNLARADIRKNAVLRRVMYGYDAIVQAMLLIGILGILNVVIYAMYPGSYDWTQSRGAYDLAQRTKNLLASLKESVYIRVIMSKNDPLYKDVQNLLDNCQAIAGKDRLNVDSFSPDADQTRYLSYSQKFPTILPAPGSRSGASGVLIVFGVNPEAYTPDPKKPAPAHSFVTKEKLFDPDRLRSTDKEKPVYSFKGEDAIIKELKFLAEGRVQRKVYFLQGNDEIDISGASLGFRRDARDNFSKVSAKELVGTLTADNYKVVGLTFSEDKPGKRGDNVLAKEGADKKKEIPEDCDTLIIAGAAKQLTTEILDAVERYMDHRDGKLIVFLDVFSDESWTKMQNSGIEGLLGKYGVKVSDEYLLAVLGKNRNPHFMPASGPDTSDNVLAQQFKRRTVLMPISARVVRPAEGGAGKFKADVLLDVDLPGFLIVEKDLKYMDLSEAISRVTILSADHDMRRKLASDGPVPVAVAVSEKEAQGEAGQPRLVVFGDTEMIADQIITRRDSISYDVIISSLDWLAKRESIGAKPKDHSQYKLDQNVDFWRMVLTPGWLLTIVIIAAGIGIWLVRRR
ncbi:MAG: hypothetical protein FJ303_07780 [Planctomycetes bacterium]|nr:hypothetical protein [Planctomycetota bacterium]